MAVITESIDVYRGEQVALNYTMTPVVDISGWTITGTLARRTNSATKSITQTATIVSGAAGTFRFTLTEELTDLTPAAYAWDVWRTDEGYEQLLALSVCNVLSTARTPPV